MIGERAVSRINGWKFGHVTTDAVNGSRARLRGCGCVALEALLAEVSHRIGWSCVHIMTGPAPKLVA